MRSAAARLLPQTSPLHRSLLARLSPSVPPDTSASLSHSANELRWMVEALLARRSRAAHRFPRPTAVTSSSSSSLSSRQTTAAPPISLANDSATSSALSSLTPSELTRLHDWIDRRRQKSEPLQYILATQPFCDLEFRVRRPVLIPRWETEEWVWRLIKAVVESRTPRVVVADGTTTTTTTSPPPIRILDLCTGTGCVAISLAHHLARQSIPVHVTAGDISSSALNLARINTRRNGVPPSIIAVEWIDVFSDGILSHLARDGPFDLVVSNPPYIAPADHDDLDPGVRLWEDRRALVAEDGATAFHRRIAGKRDVLLGPGVRGVPRIALEVGEGQAKEVCAIVRDAGFVEVAAWRDLAGIPRCVVGY